MHWSAIGIGDAPDSEILLCAKIHSLVILTRDLDFGIMVAARRMTKPSVVQLRGVDVSPDVTGLQVVDALRLF